MSASIYTKITSNTDHDMMISTEHCIAIVTGYNYSYLYSYTTVFTFQTAAAQYQCPAALQRIK